jgi:hypothetical protein
MNQQGCLRCGTQVAGLTQCPRCGTAVPGADRPANGRSLGRPAADPGEQPAGLPGRWPGARREDAGSWAQRASPPEGEQDDQESTGAYGDHLGGSRAEQTGGYGGQPTGYGGQPAGRFDGRQDLSDGDRDRRGAQPGRPAGHRHGDQGTGGYTGGHNTGGHGSGGHNPGGQGGHSSGGQGGHSSGGHNKGGGRWEPQGPEDWAGDGDERQGGRRFLVPVVAGTAAVLLVAGVLWYLLSGPGTDPGASTTNTSAEVGESDPANSRPGDVAGQVKAVDAILSISGGARSGLGPALTQLRECRQPAAGIEKIEQVTGARRDQVEQVGRLDVGAIEGGAELKKNLAAALGASLEADERFLSWARRHAAGCDADWTTDSDYRRGLAASTKATAAKKDFVAGWNPLAAEHDLPERTANEI